MGKPKVSVIVPVYNVENYLNRCVDSIINQTLKEIEIILVDDKSTDSCPQICDKYAKTDSRIKVIHKNNNEGAGYARNNGLKIAKGEYIGFVDSDDYIDSNYYENMYKSAKENNADVCYAGEKVINKKNVIFKTIESNPFNKKVVNTDSVLKNILKIDNNSKNIGMSVWRAIYKSNIIQENNILFISEREYFSEDITFNFDFFLNSKKATFAEDAYYYYRYNEKSITKTYTLDRFEKSKKLLEILTNRADKFQESEIIKTGVANLFIRFTRACLKEESCNKNKPLKDRKKRIRTIVQDVSVKNNIKIVKNMTFQENIFNYIIKNEFITLIIIFSQIRNKVKA